jgi:hypothetical protein
MYPLRKHQASGRAAASSPLFNTTHINLRSFPSLLSDPPMLSLLAKVLKFNMATKPGLDLNLAEGQGMFTGYVLEPFPPLAMSIYF